MKKDTKFKAGNPGRVKGSKNKFTSFKDALYEVFERKGGVEGLFEWANKDGNEGKFYDYMTKLLPRDVSLSGGLGMTYEEGLKKVSDAIESNADLKEQLEDEVSD